MTAMTEAAGPAEAPTGLSKHRLEALTDGVFAVAMTLLVIELKLPEDVAVHDQAELARGLVRLIPTFVAWIISFFVLAIFWFTQHRLFHFVRTIDGKLLSLNIVYLGLVSLIPFSCALTGKYARMPLSQWIYSSNMARPGPPGTAQLAVRVPPSPALGDADPHRPLPRRALSGVGAHGRGLGRRRDRIGDPGRGQHGVHADVAHLGGEPADRGPRSRAEEWLFARRTLEAVLFFGKEDVEARQAPIAGGDVALQS
jgi:hypothetical protein